MLINFRISRINIVRTNFTEISRSLNVARVVIL